MRIAVEVLRRGADGTLPETEVGELLANLSTRPVWMWLGIMIREMVQGTLSALPLEVEQQVLSAAIAPEPQPRYIFRRTGLCWHLAFGQTSGSLPDAEGLTRVHALLSRADRPISAIDLMLTTPNSVSARRDLAQLDPEQREQMNVGGSYCDDLGADARAALVAERQKWKEEMDDAESQGHESRFDDAKRQVDMLDQQLKREVPLHAQKRRADSTDPKEKARKAVYNSVEIAIRAIRNVGMHALADHLKVRIQTGTTCQYCSVSPPIPWEL
jgi:hypothetical protein